MSKITEQDLMEAVDDLAMMKYFPNESRSAVMRELRKMCPNREALKWTVSAATAKCPDWPGIAEIRGLLCTRFDAADGIDQPYCMIPGFTPAEQEAKYTQKHNEYKAIEAGDRKLIKGLFKALPAGRMQ